MSQKWPFFDHFLIKRCWKSYRYSKKRSFLGSSKGRKSGGATTLLTCTSANWKNYMHLAQKFFGEDKNWVNCLCTCALWKIWRQLFFSKMPFLVENGLNSAKTLFFVKKTLKNGPKKTVDAQRFWRGGKIVKNGSVDAQMEKVQNAIVPKLS